MEKKERLVGSHLVLPCEVQVAKGQLPATALIDSGANGISFVDESFVHDNDLVLKPLRKPCSLEVVAVRQSIAGQITHLVRLPIEIQRHKEVLPCFVTKLGQQPIILGIPWLQLHDASISWRNHTITFASEYCRQNCGVRQKRTIKGTIQKSRSVNVLDVCMIGAAPFAFLTDRARRAPRGYKTFAAPLKDAEKAQTIKLLLGYSLAEGIEGLSSYATHPVVHE